MELKNVFFVKNNRAKKYIIRILADQSIRVTIPKYGTQKEAQKFLNKHIDQLQNQVKENTKLFFEINHVYPSKYFNIRILSTNLRELTVDSIKQNVIIKIPKTKDIRSKEIQEYIHYIIEQVLRKEAKRYIPKKVVEFASKYKLKFSDIKINSAKTRWGSCSSINSLNFSLYLMQLPYELIDYVILHELSHSVHKNHSSRFYDLLNQLSNGKHKILNQKLSHFSPRIKAEYFQKL